MAADAAAPTVAPPSSHGFGGDTIIVGEKRSAVLLTGHSQQGCYVILSCT